MAQAPVPWEMYAGLAVPVVVADAEHRLVYLNPRAERYFGPAQPGTDIWSGLHLAPPEGMSAQDWMASTVLPALATGDAVPCRLCLPGAGARATQFSGSRLRHGAQWFLVLTVLRGGGVAAGLPPPDWALRDPLTGLGNRHQWEADAAAWDRAAGAAICVDIDGLGALNAGLGRHAGDVALVATAAAIVAEAPPGSAALRLGNDEFVLLLSQQEADRAAEIAARVAARAAAATGDDGRSLGLRLRVGHRSYGPGGLSEAVRAAAAQGSELRAAGGGRIALAAEVQLHRPDDAQGPAEPPGGYGRSFGSEFDGYFRRTVGRAVEQAQEFVALIDPQPGWAAVEVGAGSGRIAFDGGLAARIGEDGQLLLTDPSAPQIEVARRRARQLGLGWVRLLLAPAEDLPLVAGGADLVYGSMFLHFTEPKAAIASMARVVRPGGLVAISAGLRVEWGPVWQAALAPVRREAAARGQVLREIFVSEPELRRMLQAAGLRVERVVLRPGERASFPSADVAISVARQLQLLPLLLRDLPRERREGLQELFETALRYAFEERGPAGADLVGPMISLVTRRPA